MTIGHLQVAFFLCVKMSHFQVNQAHFQITGFAQGTVHTRYCTSKIMAYCECLAKTHSKMTRAHFLKFLIVTNVEKLFYIWLAYIQDQDINSFEIQTIKPSEKNETEWTGFGLKPALLFVRFES